MLQKKFLTRFFILCTGLLFFAQIKAQLISSTPLFPGETDSVTITFDASLGNKGLMDYTGDVYAHTGVITQESTGAGDWKHAPSWGDNSGKYKLKRVSTNKYELKIAPSIRAYYGATANEQIIRMAFVLRSGDKTKEGKTETGSDIFFDVYDKGVYVSFQKPFNRPYFAALNELVQIEATASMADSISLFINNQLLSTDNDSAISADITANEYGKFWIKAIAYSGTKTARDSFYYFVKKATETAEIPAGLKNGVQYKNDSSVYLSLIAPNKKAAFIIGDFNNWEPDTIYQMKQTPDSNRFWIELSKLETGKEYAYQFIVDGKIIADPYARKVLDPWNDSQITSSVYPNLKAYPSGKTNGIVSVFEVKPATYNWKYNDYSMPEKSELVVYELLVRDFTASHSYQGVIDSLNYLKTLGINALQLMPVMEFEGNSSWGYNPSFYFAPDKYYGTPEKLRQLIDTCHSIGMVVILDIVLNHSFGQSPMVQLYWDAANNRPAAESPWYNPAPTHDYNVGYDFNHESAFTRSFSVEVMKYWLEEYNIDGYRFDLSKGFTQKNTLGNVSAWGAYDANRVALWKSYADSIWKTNPGAYVILEHFADNTEEKELVAYGMMVWGNANGAYTEAAMGYNEGSKSDFSWGSYKNRGMAQPGLITYMESHDEERMGYKNITWGNNTNPDYSVKVLANSIERSELAAAFFFTIPGAKMVWQFGELGYDISIDQNGRTGEKPIKWEYYNDPVRNGLYDVYSALIKLKKEPAFNSTDFSLNVGSAIKYISVNHSDMDVRVAGNFSVQPAQATVSFSKTGWWYDYISGDSLEVKELQTTINLGISEYHIYTTKRFSKPNITVSVNEKTLQAQENAGFIIYPNPSSKVLNIKSKNAGSTKVEISDLSGKTVLTGIVQDNGQLNTSALNEGVYMIRLQNGNEKSAMKLFVVK